MCALTCVCLYKNPPTPSGSVACENPLSKVTFGYPPPFPLPAGGGAGKTMRSPPPCGYLTDSGIGKTLYLTIHSGTILATQNVPKSVKTWCQDAFRVIYNFSMAFSLIF